MKNWIKILAVSVTCLVIVISAGCAKPAPAPTPAPAPVPAPAPKPQTVEDFYKGKLLHYWAEDPGGSTDIWMRLLIPFLQKYSGNTVVAHNRAESGAYLGANAMFNQEKNDGTVFGYLAAGDLSISQVFKAEGVKYDLMKLTYVTRLDAYPRVIVVSKKSGWKTTDDMKKAGQIRWGMTSPLSAMHIMPALFSEAFGLNHKNVFGYAGGKEMRLAVIAGNETDALVTSLAGILSEIKAGTVTPIALVSDMTDPALPDLPLSSKLPGLDARGQRLLRIGENLTASTRMIMAPPGVPADRAAYLSSLFIKSLKDPELIAKGAPLAYVPAPLPSAECKAMLSSILEMSSADMTELKYLLLEKYK